MRRKHYTLEPAISTASVCVFLCQKFNDIHVRAFISAGAPRRPTKIPFLLAFVGRPEVRPQFRSQCVHWIEPKEFGCIQSDTDKCSRSSSVL